MPECRPRTPTFAEPTMKGVSTTRNERGALRAEPVSNQRQGTTPAHEAIREALVNTLAHAEFNTESNILIEKNKKIEKSSLKSNAKNRLLSELSKILILTNTMGWTLKYDGSEVKTDKDIELKIIN